MSKTKKITYWVATLWLSLGMVSSGTVQILKLKEETEFILKLGYPEYLLLFLGITKLLGTAAVLAPRLPLLKEWAYAGFFFTMAGALYSHIAAGSPASEIFPPVLMLVLMAVSWYFRPVERRLNPA